MEGCNSDELCLFMPSTGELMLEVSALAVIRLVLNGTGDFWSIALDGNVGCKMQLSPLCPNCFDRLLISLLAPRELSVPYAFLPPPVWLRGSCFPKPD